MAKQPSGIISKIIRKLDVAADKILLSDGMERLSKKTDILEDKLFATKTWKTLDAATDKILLSDGMERLSKKTDILEDKLFATRAWKKLDSTMNRVLCGEIREDKIEKSRELPRRGNPVIREDVAESIEQVNDDQKGLGE